MQSFAQKAPAARCSQCCLFVLAAVLLPLVLSGCTAASNAAETPQASVLPATLPPASIVTVTPSPPLPGSAAPAASDDPAATAVSTATPDIALAEGEEVNIDGGLAFRPAEGWRIVANNGMTGFAGMISLVPEDHDLEEQGPFVFLIAGAAEMIVEVADPEMAIEEVPMDELLDLALADAEEVELVEREDVVVDGAAGRSAIMAGIDPELGDIRGRVVVVRIDERRLFQMIGAADPAEWDAQAFENMLNSVRFFDPAEPDMLGELGMLAPTIDPELVAETTILPLPDSVRSLAGTTDGTISFVTDLQVAEAIAFYRAAFLDEGATERATLSVTTPESFLLTFDDWPPAEGDAVVVQGNMVDDELFITLRFETS